MSLKSSEKLLEKETKLVKAGGILNIPFKVDFKNTFSFQKK